MKILSFLLIFIFFPVYLLSQSVNVESLLKNKMTVQTSKSYYLNKTNLSRHFIKRYVNLTKSFKKDEFMTAKKYRGYRSIDTIRANRQINKLNASQNIFSLLMLARLQWDYKEHLEKKILNSAILNCRNNADSAFYFFTLGIYCKDSITELLARKVVFVKSDGKGNELVDWERINHYELNYWALMSLKDYGIYNIIDISVADIRNSFIPYFEKAITLDKKEFYFIIEMLLPLIRLGDEKTVQEKIIQYKNNYSSKEQQWLEERMKESIIRQQKAEELIRLKK